jgi:Lar family restriction alleviation protein
MEGNLKTCPFCGKSAEVETLKKNDGTIRAYRIQCTECGATTRWCDKETAAQAAWGIRVQVEQKNYIEEKKMDGHTIQVILSDEEYAEFRSLIDNSVFDEVKWLRWAINYGIKVAKRNLDRKYSLTIPDVGAVG